MGIMSALQVEFTQNSVGITTFSQSFLVSLFRFVCGVTREFWIKVLRSKVEPSKSGGGASSNAKPALLKPDMVPISHQLSTHKNHQFESIKTAYPSHRTSCISMQPNHIHISERQQAAGPKSHAKAVSTRERNGAMRGVSYVGHRTEFTRSTKGSFAAETPSTGSFGGSAAATTNRRFKAGTSSSG